MYSRALVIAGFLCPLASVKSLRNSSSAPPDGVGLVIQLPQELAGVKERGLEPRGRAPRREPPVVVLHADLPVVAVLGRERWPAVGYVERLRGLDGARVPQQVLAVYQVVFVLGDAELVRALGDPARGRGDDPAELRLAVVDSQRIGRLVGGQRADDRLAESADAACWDGSGVGCRGPGEREHHEGQGEHARDGGSQPMSDADLRGARTDAMKTPGGTASPSCDTCLWCGLKTRLAFP